MKDWVTYHQDTGTEEGQSGLISAARSIGDILVEEG